MNGAEWAKILKTQTELDTKNNRDPTQISADLLPKEEISIQCHVQKAFLKSADSILYGRSYGFLV
jgi:hypothetical protein